VEESTSIFRLALTYFIIINPIGNLPAIAAIIKDFDFQHQKRIMFREGIFTFIVALLFQFIGEYFLGLLKIDPPALSLTGGTLLFLCAVGMLFTKPQSDASTRVIQEPFIVPIATPLLAGPGTMTFIMVSAAREPNAFKITGAITIACMGVLTILMVGPYLQRALGKRGLAVLEQITGTVLLLMAVAMISQGIQTFVRSLSIT